AASYTGTFLPTPSARRATYLGHDLLRRLLISTHALREEGDAADMCLITSLRISTHALREEGDAYPDKQQSCNPDFYPRPPRGGRPMVWTPLHSVLLLFLPTPSARRATSLPTRLL